MVVNNLKNVKNLINRFFFAFFAVIEFVDAKLTAPEDDCLKLLSGDFKSQKTP